MAVVQEVKRGSSYTNYVASAYGALRAAGMWDDEEWMLAGLTGIAFHLIVDRGTCPSSPTAYDLTRVNTEAMRRIGVSSECVECLGDMRSFKGKQGKAVSLAKASLDRGVPAIAWLWDWTEFALLTGYDDTDGVFFVQAAGGGGDPVLYENLGKLHGHPFLFVQVLGESTGFDVREACRSSLEYAVVCWTGDGFSKSPIYNYTVGAEGYETLIDCLTKSDSNPLGFRYILKTQADARAAIARYLARMTAESVLPGLEESSDLYAKVAPLLQRASDLHPPRAPWERPIDSDAVPEAARLLRQAADLEQRAMSAIENTL
jgi:hypothetical protein